jgi:hypothetical protein
MYLKDFFELAREDPKMSAAHVSLYFALRCEWELQCCPEQMVIGREEVMLQARIAGRSTFQKCLHDLHDGGYVKYLPAVGRAKSYLKFGKLV